MPRMVVICRELQYPVDGKVKTLLKGDTFECAERDVAVLTTIQKIAAAPVRRTPVRKAGSVQAANRAEKAGQTYGTRRLTAED